MSYNSAHAFYESELMESIHDALNAIADDIPDQWYRIGDDDMEIEHESRDGFWSHNNGGAEIVFAGTANSLYGTFQRNPFIAKWLEHLGNDMRSDAKESEGFIEWAKGREGDTDALVDDWLAETDYEFETEWLENDDYGPFIKSCIMIQGADGYRHEGAVDADTELKIDFHFSYNDDLGYGRDWTTTGGSKGAGNRPVVERTFIFKACEAEWVLERIKELPDLVAKTPADTTDSETLHSPGMQE